MISRLLDNLPDKIVFTSEQLPNKTIVSASTFRIIVAVMDQIGRGHAVSIAPIDRELSTKEAAQILNVSRPFIIKLLDD